MLPRWLYHPNVARPLLSYLQKTLKDSQSKVYTDSSKLKQILQNLISNATKFTHKGHINFGYVLKDNFLEFYVEDTGIGIPDEEKEKVFEPFFTKKERGTGLGLAVVKKIIENHQGEIKVSDREGGGTVFSLWIPMR